jgi:surface carbohydrate biosynthesis protein
MFKFIKLLISTSRTGSIFLSVETKVRELDAKILLAMLLAVDSKTVFIGHKPILEDFAILHKNGLFLDKSAAKTKFALFGRLKKRCHSICVMDEEGFIILEDQTYREMRVDQDAFNLVDLFIAWGNNHARVVSEKIVDSQNSICVLGNPRFDLISHHYPGYISKKKPWNLPSQDFLLIASKFGTHNIIGGSAALITKELHSGLLQSKEQIQKRKAYFHSRELLFDDFVDLINHVIEQIPELIVVIRPHPSENGDLWEKNFSENPRVVIARNDNVHLWLNYAKFMIHNGCMTSIESFMIGTPAIYYDKRSDFKFELPASYSFKVSSLNSLIQLSQEILNTKKSTLDILPDCDLNIYIPKPSVELYSQGIASKIIELCSKRGFCFPVS